MFVSSNYGVGLLTGTAAVGEWRIVKSTIRYLNVGLALVALLALVGALVSAEPARAQAAPSPNETRTIEGANVDLWLPAAASGRRPLVLFSHGVSGCRNQSAYLMAALAGAGMIVAAPDHADQRCGQPLTLDSLPQDIRDPALFQDSRYAGRRDQLRALRDALMADPVLGPQIDPNQLALVGHSLGGYTVLAMAGAQPGTVPTGLKAVVALAPYLLPYGGTPEMITVPVLIEAGLHDAASANLPTFQPRLGGPKCVQVFPEANHFAWVDSPDLPADLSHPKYWSPTATAAVKFIQQALDNVAPTAPDPSIPSADTACN